eukprot:TRINITY_DN51358_c0_g1_i1.p1 TRINITY_DN51358_c0_g1~~TRINITY_DN51358_c0_g1_i1.p1  ORF type:complete len:306 (-),score=53.17 TRINITY_DN51358_c0_g1_i1:155-1072(-)
MDKAIPSGSKICTSRIQQREHDRHKDRIRNIKSQVDTRPPMVCNLAHIRTNLKKEQMMEDRYSEIDRDNRILLKKMTGIMKSSGNVMPGGGSTPRDLTPRAPPGPASLNRDRRKQELLRITRENQNILKRIQQAQPVYNHIEWADDHRKNVNYLKNRCEFPLVLRTPRRGSAELVNMENDDGSYSARPGSSRAAMHKDLNDGSNTRYVLKEGMKLSEAYYLVDMSTDGRNLFVSAFDSNTQTTLELSVKEKTHRKLYREANGDYSKIAQRLRVSDGGKLLLDGMEEEAGAGEDELNADGMIAKHD